MSILWGRYEGKEKGVMKGGDKGKNCTKKGGVSKQSMCSAS